MSASDLETAKSLVLEGWDQLRLQRPLAAWASWRRALGYVPDFPDARQTLKGLEQSPQLPAAARSVLRFQPPGNPQRRRRWDALFKDRDLEDLTDAAETFGVLAGEDSEDDAAWYNYAACLAWLGRNVEAVTTLERVVGHWAESQFDRAVEAWTLAEVLRQGAGAEQLADDLAYSWMIQCSEEDAERVLAHAPGLQPVPPPLDPTTGQPRVPAASAWTWLDRPMPAATSALRVADLPRVLVQIVKPPGAIRMSSPDPIALDRVRAHVMMAFGNRVRPLRREASPLPLVLLDAAVWTFRLPPGLDPEAERALARAAIEQYYEYHWIHVPRHGLGSRSPLDAARSALAGDAVARAKLTAVVRFREQIGTRPWTLNLYHGYPFDRLRRRLGLDLRDPLSIDRDDCTCMSAGALARLDPAALATVPLTEAYESAAALRDDHLTARFAAALARRDSPTLARLDAPSLIATLVREAMKSNASDEALEWLERARSLNGGRDRRTFDLWAAEIHARTGAPATALQTYQEILEQDPGATVLAFDAAETLLDNGYPGHARPLLLHALEQSRRVGDQAAAGRAEALLEQGTLEPSDGRTDNRGPVS